MCDIGYVPRQKHCSHMNRVWFLIWGQHDIYQEYLWRENVRFSVMVLVGVPWEGSFLGLCAAPPICGWGEPSKWYLTHNLERWEHFMCVCDGLGKKQRQCLLLAPTDLCYTSLSASVVIVLFRSGFTPCEKSWVLTARKQSTGKEIQSAMFRCVYLDRLTTQISRKASVSRSPDLLHGKHLRCLVCLCMLNGRWMDITPVPVHCVLFLVALPCPLLIMSHPETVYIGFFWFLWFAMLNRCLWAKCSSSEGLVLCALTCISALACCSSARARPWFGSVFNFQTSPGPESHGIT